MRPPTKSRCRPGGSRASVGPSGVKRSRSTPFGTTWTRSAATPDSTYMRFTNSLGTQPSRTFSPLGPAPSARGPRLGAVLPARARPRARDRAELPRLDQREAAGRRRTQVRRPLVADLDVGDVRQGRVGAHAAAFDALDAQARLPVQAASDLLVDDREARVQRVVTNPADRTRVGGQRVLRGACARVVGLERVDVRREAGRRLDRRLKTLEQTGLERDAVDRRGEALDA